jgi:hypothetical protein
LSGIPTAEGMEEEEMSWIGYFEQRVYFEIVSFE